MKTALITGITGQDGSYLAELLLKKMKNPGMPAEKHLFPGELIIRDSVVRREENNENQS